MNFSKATCFQQVTRGLKNIWLSDSLKDQIDARRLCHGCRMLVECTIYASKVEPTAGVWAGKVIGSVSTEELFRNGGNRVPSRRSQAKAVRARVK